MLLAPLTAALREAQEEWKHADEVCTQILSAGGATTDWTRLLEPFPFFTAFKNYLQVIATLSSCTSGS